MRESASAAVDGADPPRTASGRVWGVLPMANVAGEFKLPT
jgi:hypothetical protein